MAHLLEHIMFEGSIHAPNFDKIMQRAGGENNAYTNPDIAHYYDIIPKSNLESVLWLEADRMANLKLSRHSFRVQKKIVLEEFSETCLNEPFGDAWHHICRMAYQQSPYRWPSIGLDMEHISQISHNDLTAFYKKYYVPNNCILAISGPIHSDEALYLTRKYFSSIPGENNLLSRSWKKDPTISKSYQTHESPSGVNNLFLFFNIGDRLEREFFLADFLSDVLSGSRGARLFQSLVREAAIFSQIDAYTTENYEQGLFIIEGRLRDGIKVDQGYEAIWNELLDLQSSQLPVAEIERTFNKIEHHLLLSECNVLNKAMNLTTYESMGDVSMINREIDIYKSLNAQELLECARSIFKPEHSASLAYIV